MERIFTEQELKQFIEAEPILRTKGLIVDDIDGADLAAHNAERVAAYFDVNPHIPVTVQAVLDACELMREQLHWKPEDQVRFENIYVKLTSQEKQAFDSWARPQRLVNSHGNNAAILEYLKQNQHYEVTHERLLQAATQRIPTKLEWEALPVRPDPRQHASDGSFMAKDDKNPRYRNGRINHAYVEPGSKTEASQNLDPSEERWREMAEALRGNTHSKTAELERIHGRTWRETYELRKKALNQNPVSIGRFGVS